MHSILDPKYIQDDKIDTGILYQIAFYLNDYKKKVGYIILPKTKNSEEYEIKSLYQKPLEIKVRHMTKNTQKKIMKSGQSNST